MMVPEFSRPFAASSLPKTGQTLRLEASQDECTALAARMRIPQIYDFICTFRLEPGSGGVVMAEGELLARVQQICVVTLEPFDTEVRERFRVEFVPAGSEKNDPDPFSIDEIAYEQGVIDLGEAAAEQLALALDPYPHAPFAVLPDAADAADDDEENSRPVASPFGVLARWQRSH
jgi:uncharacterized metal-binding protein YceD (DUF177 family)